MYITRISPRKCGWLSIKNGWSRSWWLWAHLVWESINLRFDSPYIKDRAELDGLQSRVWQGRKGWKEVPFCDLALRRGCSTNEYSVDAVHQFNISKRFISTTLRSIIILIRQSPNIFFIIIQILLRWTFHLLITRTAGNSMNFLSSFP